MCATRLGTVSRRLVRRSGAGGMSRVTWRGAALVANWVYIGWWLFLFTVGGILAQLSSGVDHWLKVLHFLPPAITIAVLTFGLYSSSMKEIRLWKIARGVGLAVNGGYLLWLIWFLWDDGMVLRYWRRDWYGPLFGVPAAVGLKALIQSRRRPS